MRWRTARRVSFSPGRRFNPHRLPARPVAGGCSGPGSGVRDDVGGWSGVDARVPRCCRPWPDAAVAVMATTPRRPPRRRHRTASGAPLAAAPAAVAATASITPASCSTGPQIHSDAVPGRPRPGAHCRGVAVITPAPPNLGVGDADGVVYGLGAFSGNVIASFRQAQRLHLRHDRAAAPSSAPMPTNLGARPLRSTAVSIKASGDITFQGLGPLDQVIEVNSPSSPPSSQHRVPRCPPAPPTR